MERGTVISVEGKNAVVEMAFSPECQACGACRRDESGRMIVVLPNLVNAKVGDQVLVTIDSEVVLLAGFIIYIVPLIFFFSGYGIGLFLASWLRLKSQAVGIGTALLMFVASYLVIRYIDNQAKLSRRFEPRIYGIIGEQKKEF